MILLIDAGNTRVKLGWVDAETGEREEQTTALTHDQIAQTERWLSTLPVRPKAAIGVNVASEPLADMLDALLQRHYGLKVNWATSQAVAGGIRNAYDTPSQLGPDRWVSMIGIGERLIDAPCLLASFGTATTVDTLGPDRIFHGGLILPGPALMGAALASGTARLPLAQGSAVAFPGQTHQAISSGIAAAQAGAVLRQWREGLERFGMPPNVYAAGGAWPSVQAELQRVLSRAQNDLGLEQDEIQWLSAPVLDGLAVLARSL